MRSIFVACLSVFLCITSSGSAVYGVIYRNPRVYNVDYSFELVPDPNKVDRTKDLKLWLPIPREWDSQKAVKIISFQPPPHARYEDPEHGNRMFFWDFGKEPESSSHKVDIKFRLESYEFHAEIDPNQIGPYDKTNKEYDLYTRNTHTVNITAKIKELAEIAVGDVKNPYLQAKQIFEFTRKKMRYRILDFERGRGTKCLLDYPITDEKTGKEYYEGSCNQYSVLFVALSRAVGIPARSVVGFIGWSPWIKAKDSKPLYNFETKLSPDGLVGAQHYGALRPHTWSEFLLPGYGWIPVDPSSYSIPFGHLGNQRVIMGIGRDVRIGPHAPENQNEGYGSQWVALHNGTADMLFSGVWNIAGVCRATVEVLHSTPFPVIKYFIYFCSATILAIFVGGLAGYICLHKFVKYALLGLAGVVPFVGLALPIVLVSREKKIRCSKVSFVMLFWIFSVSLLLLLLFPIMVETDIVSWGAWRILSIIVVCILSILVSWILVGFTCRKSWIKNKPIRVVIKTILFSVFWIVAAYILYILGVWVMFSLA